MKLDKISKTVERFMALRQPEHRYASFDYCYNHFHPDNRKKRHLDPNDMERSCLVLFAYLGSWGMLRGSTFIGQEASIKYLEPTVKYVNKQYKYINQQYVCKGTCWDIDVCNYTNPNNRNIEKLFEIAGEIEEYLATTDYKKWHRKQARDGKNRNITATLVTKIMLGVFGCVPAFDSRVKETFGGFTPETLERIGGIYWDENNKTEIELLRKRKEYRTLVFKKGDKSHRYTQAKIIDMYGFQRNKKV